MNTKPLTETVSETKAMRLLGGTSPRLRQELRQLQHRIFDRGVNQAYSRRYQLKDVLALRKERADDVDPVDDRTDPDGLDSDHWTIAQTINIEPHPSDL